MARTVPRALAPALACVVAAACGAPSEGHSGSDASGITTASVHGSDGSSAGATTTSAPATSTASTSGASADATSSSGQPTTGDPLPLLCDPGFAFDPDPAESGAILLASFTHAEPLAYVDLAITGPGAPTITWAGISASDPWTWNWQVIGLNPGVWTASFSAGEPAQPYGGCQFQVIDTGPAPEPPDPPDPTGADCLCGEGDGCDHCPMVGACLDPPSPVGPNGPGMTWECLDNAGCDNGSCRIWCPFEPCDMEKHPGGCPNNTEACWVPPWIDSYEEACKQCCESAPQSSCWDEAYNLCRYPGECGLPLPF
ncbi:MAG: hypothetical protein H6713_28745 [Myxococcales bacterium]|nr:hypothetical protein [Myxococcales bacterium]